MRFHVENFERHKDAGVVAHRAGKFSEARYHFLKAAEALYHAAAESEGVLRETRIANAKKLTQIAQRIKDTPAKSRAQARAIAENGEGAKFSPISEKPSVRFGDIAGLEDAKQEIKLKMVYPFLYPEQAARFLVQRGGGILLFGPPGTGKTLLAKAVAGEIEAAFFTVRPSEVMSKWVGEAEKNIQSLFDTARLQPRSVLFIDEIEALVPARHDSGSTVMQRVVPQILNELEGFQKHENPLLFIGATNEPWSLDPAVLRPGRFDDKIYVPLPDVTARLQILQMNLEKRPLADDVDLPAIAARLDGYSGADIRNICSKAANIPFLESIEAGTMRDISAADFEKVISSTPPSVSKKSVAKYAKYAQET
jgi:transitional endoplasmic reticulum ATPase